MITRFDAAREYLRLSLGGLTEDHEFAVVLFGDQAVPLEATPKLVRATKAKVRAALAELNKIEAGAPRQNRPDGVLLGGTNLHAGIAAAYRITGKGRTKDSEFVDDGSFLQGADTLFVLSDGAPGTDNFVQKDRRDPGDQAGDQESGTLTEGTPELWFQGPYSYFHYPWLMADIERMNLFRKCEIHCVGIGEANHQMLRELAELGMGAAVRVEGEGR